MIEVFSEKFLTLLKNLTSMIGSPDELEKLAATGCSLIVDCKNISTVSLINIVLACKKGGSIITLNNIKSKSIEALLEIADAGKGNFVLDTRWL